MSREDAVETSGGEVEIVLLGGGVFADLDHVAEIFDEEVRIGRRPLDSDHLAFQHRRPLGDQRRDPVRIGIERQTALSGEIGERAVAHHREAMRSAGVGAREIDHLHTRVGDVHAGHDRIVLAGLEGRDDARPILRDDLAGDLHAGAEIVREIDLEAGERAVGLREVPRRIGAFRGDAHRLLLRARRPARDAQRHRGACEPEGQSLQPRHVSFPSKGIRIQRTTVAAARRGLWMHS